MRPLPERYLPGALLLAILGIACFFIFFRLGQPDSLTDEAEIAFRSVGYLDFLATPDQTTPWEWFASPPGWVSWSFHDHPPLVFFLEHLLMNVFGDSLVVVRLPFAIFGFLSLLLLYAVARQLTDWQTGALAVALLASCSYFLWISRIGLQEIVVIFFTLLAAYLAQRAVNQPWWLLVWGMVIGLGLLTKYTALAALVISMLYWRYFWPAVFRSRFLYAGLSIAVVLFLPVIAYNIAMFSRVGHFDVQIASLLGQATPEWSVLPGKDIGSLRHRFATLYAAIQQGSSPIFFGLATLSVLALAYRWLQQRIEKTDARTTSFLLVVFIFYQLLLLLIGPSVRFWTMALPWLTLMTAVSIRQLQESLPPLGRRLLHGAMVVFISYQLFFSYQTVSAGTPLGPLGWTYSPVRFESQAWGYNQLDAYLAQLLDTKKPAVQLTLPDRLAFIEQFRKKDFRGIGDNPAAAYLVIYDPRMNAVAKLWLLDRRYYYDGWPIISVDEYLAVLQQAGERYFSDLGITDYFYISTTPATFTGGNAGYSAAAADFAQALGEPSQTIFGSRGQVVFKIFSSGQPF